MPRPGRRDRDEATGPRVPRRFAPDGRLIVLPEAPPGFAPYAHLEPLVDVLLKRADLATAHAHSFVHEDQGRRRAWSCVLPVPLDWQWANQVAMIPETVEHWPREFPEQPAETVRHVSATGDLVTIACLGRAESSYWRARGWATGEPWTPPPRRLRLPRDQLPPSRFERYRLHVPREFTEDGRLVVLAEAPSDLPSYAHLEPVADLLEKTRDLTTPKPRHWHGRDGRHVTELRVPLDWDWLTSRAVLPPTVDYVGGLRQGEEFDEVVCQGNRIVSRQRADSRRWRRRGWKPGQP